MKRLKSVWSVVKRHFGRSLWMVRTLSLVCGLEPQRWLSDSGVPLMWKILKTPNFAWTFTDVDCSGSSLISPSELHCLRILRDARNSLSFHSFARRGIPAGPLLSGYCGPYEVGMELSMMDVPQFSHIHWSMILFLSLSHTPSFICESFSSINKLQ